MIDNVRAVQMTTNARAIAVHISNNFAASGSNGEKPPWRNPVARFKRCHGPAEPANGSRNSRASPKLNRNRRRVAVAFRVETATGYFNRDRIAFCHPYHSSCAALGEDNFISDRDALSHFVIPSDYEHCALGGDPNALLPIPVGNN